MRSRFDEQLDRLQKEMQEMGALCEAAIARSSTAMLNGDSALAAEVKPLDDEIDRRESEIESLCLRLLLQQQPVARDLRQISAALKMISDMERIGDQASDIAEIVRFLQRKPDPSDGPLHEMAEAAVKMVSASLSSFIRLDLELAQTVIAYDDVVDARFEDVKKALIGHIAGNPEDGAYALDLLMIAKYLERIGDHATNIAEWAEFAVTGIHKGELEV